MRLSLNPYYVKKVAACGFLIFFALWVVGTLRGLTLPYPEPLPLSVASSERGVYSSSFPVANNLKQIGLLETPAPLVLDQLDIEKIRIHEKKALLTSSTTAFADDEAATRSEIASQQASVFNETNTGIAPARKLILEVGVHPDKFDPLVKRLRQIGVLSSISVEQKDRTGEFRKLHAQRQSLKKHLESILKLRGANNPAIDDALKLEQKVQDIEKELQSLGVQFGDFLGKESYYHVNITLVEYQAGDRHDRTYTTPQRILHAFFWAVVWWFAAALAVGLVAATIASVIILRQKAPERGG